MNIKQTIRAWLGLDTLPSVEMYKAMESKQRERHLEIMQALNAIEKRFENSRPIQLNEPGVEIVDWEAFQRQALKWAQDESKEN